MLMYVVIGVTWGLRVYDKSQTHIFQQHVICVYIQVWQKWAVLVRFFGGGGGGEGFRVWWVGFKAWKASFLFQTKDSVSRKLS